MAKKAKTKKKSDLAYERVREKLEQVVGKLEQGDQTLEDSLCLYEEGVSLIRAAHEKLDAVEKKLEVLKPRSDGTHQLVDGEDVVGRGGARGAASSPADEADEEAPW